MKRCHIHSNIMGLHVSRKICARDAQLLLTCIVDQFMTCLLPESWSCNLNNSFAETTAEMPAHTILLVLCWVVQVAHVRSLMKGTLKVAIANLALTDKKLPILVDDSIQLNEFLHMLVDLLGLVKGNEITDSVNMVFSFWYHPCDKARHRHGRTARCVPGGLHELECRKLLTWTEQTNEGW